MNEGFRNAVQKDDVDDGLVFSGQVSGLIKESLPAGEIVKKLMDEAQEVLNKKIELV